MTTLIKSIAAIAVSSTERIYRLPFELIHDGATTHACDWLLRELEFDCDDDIACQVIDPQQLQVKLQSIAAEQACEEHCARTFAVVEGILARAWERDCAHKAAADIFVRDMV